MIYRFGSPTNNSEIIKGTEFFRLLDGKPMSVLQKPLRGYLIRLTSTKFMKMGKL